MQRRPFICLALCGGVGGWGGLPYTNIAPMVVPLHAMPCHCSLASSARPVRETKTGPRPFSRCTRTHSVFRAQAAGPTQRLPHDYRAIICTIFGCCRHTYSTTMIAGPCSLFECCRHTFIVLAVRRAGHRPYTTHASCIAHGSRTMLFSVVHAHLS